MFVVVNGHAKPAPPSAVLGPPVGARSTAVVKEIFQARDDCFHIIIVIKIMTRNCKYVGGRRRAGRTCHREVNESACRICVGLNVLLCVAGLSRPLSDLTAHARVVTPSP